MKERYESVSVTKCDTELRDLFTLQETLEQRS